MRLSTLINFFFLLLTLNFPALAAKDEDFTIYQAQSRSPEELKKAAEGVMNGARISVFNNKIVIAGTKSQRAAVLKLFAELDHRLHNYVVSVRAAVKGQANREARAVEGKVGTGNVIVGKRSGVLQRQGGGSVSVGGEAGRVAVSGESVDEDSAEDTGQSVVVMDGGHAKIGMSSAFSSGVVVHLRSIGKSGAHLKIFQENAHGLKQQTLLSEIDVPLGKWRTLGGIRSQETGGSGEWLGSSKSRGQSQQDIQVKVELDQSGD